MITPEILLVLSLLCDNAYGYTATKIRLKKECVKRTAICVKKVKGNILAPGEAILLCLDEIK